MNPLEIFLERCANGVIEGLLDKQLDHRVVAPVDAGRALRRSAAGEDEMI